MPHRRHHPISNRPGADCRASVLIVARQIFRLDWKVISNKSIFRRPSGDVVQDAVSRLCDRPPGDREEAEHCLGLLAHSARKKATAAMKRTHGWEPGTWQLSALAQLQAAGELSRLGFGRYLQPPPSVRNSPIVNSAGPGNATLGACHIRKGTSIRVRCPCRKPLVFRPAPAVQAECSGNEANHSHDSSASSDRTEAGSFSDPVVPGGS